MFEGNMLIAFDPGLTKIEGYFGTVRSCYFNLTDNQCRIIPDKVMDGAWFCHQMKRILSRVNCGKTLRAASSPRLINFSADSA